MEPIIEVPDWLLAEQPVAKRSPQLLKQLTEETYSNFFEVVLDKVAAGQTFRSVIEEDGRGITPAKMMSWIKRDEQREQRYYQAQEVGMELTADELVGIADAADDPLEDVQRSSLRIETRKWLLKTRHKARYGDTKQLAVTQQRISSDHLTNLASRLVALRKGSDGVYDVEAGTHAGDITDVE